MKPIQVLMVSLALFSCDPRLSSDQMAWKQVELEDGLENAAAASYKMIRVLEMDGEKVVEWGWKAEVKWDWINRYAMRDTRSPRQFTPSGKPIVNLEDFMLYPSGHTFPASVTCELALMDSDGFVITSWQQEVAVELFDEPVLFQTTSLLGLENLDRVVSGHLRCVPSKMRGKVQRRAQKQRP